MTARKQPAKAPARREPVLADGRPVFCSHDELVPVERLIPNPRNPNQHPKSQVAMLAKIIDAQGWRDRITVSTRSGFIVKGHGRLAAAKLLGSAVAPVDYQDYADEASEWADMIADNRIAELADMDKDALGSLLEELQADGFEMELTGFDEDALAKIVGSEGEPEPDEYAERFEVVVECQSEEQQEDIFRKLTEEGFTCRLLTL